MSVMYIALPIALLLGAAGMVACVRCIWAGQYDDLDTPPLRILNDEPDLSRSRSVEAEAEQDPVGRAGGEPSGESTDTRQ